LLTLNGLTLARGSRALIEGAQAQLFPGHKAGLIGANGSGKSSLFALLRGELLPEAGEATLPPSWVVAHVAQETPALECSALDYVLDGDRELRNVERAIGCEQDGTLLAELHERLRLIDGYTAAARAQRLLAGLGFAQDAVERSVASFSGGWRMRLNLAQALMCRSDLLLLDEPTNHLDLDAVLWLEGYLRDWPGTVLLIAHDRDFLDAVIDEVWHLDQGRLLVYGGNFSRFERTRAEQLGHQQALFERQQRAVAHLQSYIDRFRAQATKARQAQSRIKALERLERVAAVRADQDFEFSFPLPSGAPSPLLVLDRAAAGYGSRRILAGITLTLMPGARIALLGRNGAGKSTLVKLLTGAVAPMAGERVEGRGLLIGYFAQHQLESLDGQASPLLHLRRIDPLAREQAQRDFLGGFRFQGERVDAPVDGLSGGERARLALALICWTRPNLLILDEPTNHLDMAMRDALTFALQEYQGAVVLVSHDRQLVRSTAEDLYLVEDGQVLPFDGDLDDYAARLAQRASARATGASDTAGEAADPASRRDQRRLAAQARDQMAALRRPLQRRIERAEQQLAAVAARQSACAALLADETLYAPGQKDRLQQVLHDSAQLKADSEALEAEWLAAQEALEALDLA
jgi:ATP-binding cassette subfamily F protein 3